MTVTATITSKGQVTIPKLLRDYLALDQYRVLNFTLRQQRIIVEPVKKDIFSLRGSVKPRQKPEDFKKVRQLVRQKMAEAVANESLSR